MFPQSRLVGLQEYADTAIPEVFSSVSARAGASNGGTGFRGEDGVWLGVGAALAGADNWRDRTVGSPLLVRALKNSDDAQALEQGLGAVVDFPIEARGINETEKDVSTALLTKGPVGVLRGHFGMLCSNATRPRVPITGTRPCLYSQHYPSIAPLRPISLPPRWPLPMFVGAMPVISDLGNGWPVLRTCCSSSCFSRAGTNTVCSH